MVWDAEGDRVYRDNLKPDRPIDDDRVVRIMRKFGVPNRYIGCRVSKIPDDGAEYRRELESFVEQLKKHDFQGRGLILIGPFGSGKTGAAVALIYEVTRQWGKCRFVSARDVGRIANDYGHEKQRQWADLRRYQFVVLDEVGCEVTNKESRESQQIKQSVEDLLRHRYDAGLMTVITTNMQVPDLMNRYACLASIFMDAYGFLPVTGVNWRKRKE